MYIHILTLVISFVQLCNLIDCSMPGTSVHRLLFPPPRDLPNPGIKLISPVSPALTGRSFTSKSSGKTILILRAP